MKLRSAIVAASLVCLPVLPALRRCPVGAVTIGRAMVRRNVLACEAGNGP
ncbi:hypothetical protein GGD63_002889 [Bradyrhizobium sp. cir1]|nr:hypothetical protein [Bradyrhizobium sp. cir1]